MGCWEWVRPAVRSRSRSRAASRRRVAFVRAICASGEASAENPIVKCDGEHSEEVGYHLACLNPPLEAAPLDEWFCPSCQDKGLYVVQAIKDKKMMAMRGTGKRCVHYLVEWAGGRVRSGWATIRGSRSASCRAPT